MPPAVKKSSGALQWCAASAIVLCTCIYFEPSASFAASDEGSRASIESAYFPVDSAQYLENLYQALASALDNTNSAQTRRDTLKFLVRTIDSTIVAQVVDSLQLTVEERDRAFQALRSNSEEFVKPYLHLASLNVPEVVGQAYTTTQTYTMPVAMSELFDIAALRVCDLTSRLLFGGKTGALGRIIDPTVGSVCAWLLTRILKPLAGDLEQYSFVKDQIRLIVEHKPFIRKAILEMAVVQMTVNAQPMSFIHTRLLFSSAELELQVSGTVKAGFDLTDNFQLFVDPRSHTISILLPEPTILSTQVVPYISIIEQGWVAKIGKAQINQAMAMARSDIVNDAIRLGILEDANNRARSAIEQLMWPLRSDPRNPYAIEIMIGNNRQTRFRLEQLSLVRATRPLSSGDQSLASQIKNAVIVGSSEFAGDSRVKQVLDLNQDGNPEVVLNWAVYGGNMTPFDELYQLRGDSLFPISGMSGAHILLESHGKVVAWQELWLENDPHAAPSKKVVFTYKYYSGSVQLIGTDTVNSSFR